MIRKSLLQMLGLVLAAFGTVWGLLEAGAYFGIGGLAGTGALGYALLASVALNLAVGTRWIMSAAGAKPVAKTDKTRGGEESVGQSGYPLASELARKITNATLIEVMLAGGDSFYTEFSKALSVAERSSGIEMRRVRVLLRRSSRASSRSLERYKRLERRHRVSVEIRWYDWDFMLRGCSFDRQSAYFSYFLREGSSLTGRINQVVLVKSTEGGAHRFLMDMFTRTFDAYFSRPDAQHADRREEFIGER